MPVFVSSSPRPDQDHAAIRIGGAVLQWHPRGPTVDLDGHDVFMVYDLIDAKAKRPERRTVKVKFWSPSA